MHFFNKTYLLRLLLLQWIFYYGKLTRKVLVRNCHFEKKGLLHLSGRTVQVKEDKNIFKICFQRSSQKFLPCRI